MSYPLPLIRDIRRWFRPAIDAIFTWNLPWSYRWRLLLLQPLEFLGHMLKTVPYVLKRPFTVEWIQVRPGEFFRVLVFKPKGLSTSTTLRPIHVSIHGGAFCGGLPELQAAFCNRVCEETGAVAISISYRYAPVHPFPAAIDDVDAIIRYIRDNAIYKYGADPNLLTVSGASAGGNLALAATQQPDCHAPSPVAIKAMVVYYPVCELRLSPGQKPKPPGMPAKDPIAVLFPLFDSYAGPMRAQNVENPRLSPMLASLDTIPEDILFVIPTIDILLHEELTFVERLRKEAAQDPSHSKRRIETLMVEGQFHGWNDLPGFTEDMKTSTELALSTSVKFLKDAHAKYGYTL